MTPISLDTIDTMQRDGLDGRFSEGNRMKLHRVAIRHYFQSLVDGFDSVSTTVPRAVDQGIEDDRV